MATNSKMPKDPTEVAMSAIQDALEMRGPDARPALSAQREAFQKALSVSRHYALRDVFALDDGSIQAVALTLYQVLSQQGDAFDADAPGYLAENAAIVNQLVA